MTSPLPVDPSPQSAVDRSRCSAIDSPPCFRFKRFSLDQNGVAMRINTDGVLLGAWATLPTHTDAPKVLDIGTGCGVIALMAAQRLSSSNLFHTFSIDAIEPHPSSARAAESNFQASPWASQTHLFSCSLQEFRSQPQEFRSQPQEPSNRTTFPHRTLYDMILSNPPYFADSLRPPSHDRRFVRHTDSLSHAELLAGVAELLHPSGCFSVVLPTLQQKGFIATAATMGLILRRETLVYTVPDRPPKRVLMEFARLSPPVSNGLPAAWVAKKEEPLQSDSITIHDTDSKSFSAEYKQLTKEFYIAF